MGQIILNRQHVNNRIKQLIKRGEQAITTSLLLKMPPIAFNRVQHGAVRRQPEREGAVFKVSQHRFRLSTVMIRGIVQNQNNRSFARSSVHEMVDEIAEGFTVLLSSHHINELVSAPVVSAKDVPTLLLTRGGDTFLCPTLHPAANDNREQPYGGLVHKE